MQHRDGGGVARRRFGQRGCSAQNTVKERDHLRNNALGGGGLALGMPI